MTPANLFNQETEYFAMIDEASDERALFALKWILYGKFLQVKTRLCITQGDEETFGFVCDALVELLTKNKLEEIKSEKQ